MKKGKLAICDMSERYAQRLAEDIGQEKGFPWETAAWTDVESLMKQMEAEPPDILLLSEELYDPQKTDFSRYSGTKLILLTEDETDPERQPPCITRYQSIREIMEDLLEICGGQRNEGQAVRRVYSGVTSIYSPVGRCGKTGFALALGQTLAQRTRTLYLNMENWHGFYQLMKMDPADWKGGDLSDLIYSIRTGNTGQLFRFSQVVQSFGSLDYVMPVRGEMDLREVKEEEWEEVITLAIRDGGYRRVILDMGSQTDDILRLFGICGRIFIPGLSDPVSAAKLSQFLRALKDFGDPDCIGRTRCIQLPPWKEGMESEFPAGLMHGPYAAFARKMAEENES